MPTLRRSAAALLLTFSVGCAWGSRDLASDLSGLPSADAFAGVRLGMSLAELRRARPSLALAYDRMRDTVGGYAVVYELDPSNADSALMAVGATREFASTTALDSAWDASFATGSGRYGRPAMCVTMLASAAPDDRWSTRLAQWNTGRLWIATTGTEGRRSKSSLFFTATERAAPAADAHKALELTVTRHGVVEQVTTAVVTAFRPRGTGPCETIDLTGPARGERTVSVHRPVAAPSTP